LRLAVRLLPLLESFSALIDRNKALLYARGVAEGRDMINFSDHTKTCHEASIPQPPVF